MSADLSRITFTLLICFLWHGALKQMHVFILFFAFIALKVRKCAILIKLFCFWIYPQIELMLTYFYKSSFPWILTYFLFDPLPPPVVVLRDPQPHFDVSDVMGTFSTSYWWKRRKRRKKRRREVMLWWLSSLNPAQLSQWWLLMLWHGCSVSLTLSHQLEIKPINTQVEIVSLSVFVCSGGVRAEQGGHTQRGPCGWVHYVLSLIHTFTSYWFLQTTMCNKSPLNARFCEIKNKCLYQNKTRLCLCVYLFTISHS